jgi:hypothetical protein
MASNQEAAVKRAISASGGKTDTPAVQYAYNAYVQSMLNAGQKPKDVNSFK